MTMLPSGVSGTEPLRILVADDEPFAVRRVQSLVARTEGLEMLDVATSRQALADAVIALDPDIILADASFAPWNMAGLAATPEEQRAPLILFSVSEQDAFQAFEVGTCDLVVKPIDTIRLGIALRRAAAIARGRRALNEVACLTAANARLRTQIRPSGGAFVQELWLRGMAGEAVRLPVSMIDWVARLDNYVSIHVEGRQLLYRTSLARLAAKLNPEDFVRLHRSALVRVERIRCLERATQDRVDVVLADGTRLPAGRTHGRALRSRMLRRGTAEMCDMDDTPPIGSRV